jgi:hypothetical protein
MPGCVTFDSLCTMYRDRVEAKTKKPDLLYAPPGHRVNTSTYLWLFVVFCEETRTYGTVYECTRTHILCARWVDYEPTFDSYSYFQSVLCGVLYLLR